MRIQLCAQDKSWMSAWPDKEHLNTQLHAAQLTRRVWTLSHSEPQKKKHKNKQTKKPVVFAIMCLSPIFSIQGNLLFPLMTWLKWKHRRQKGVASGTRIKAYLSLYTSVHCWLGPLGHTRCPAFSSGGVGKGDIWVNGYRPIFATL